MQNLSLWIASSQHPRNGADYDIAIDAGEKIAREKMLKIASDIDDSNIHVFVDVVDLHNVSEDFKNSITKDLVEWTQN